MNKPVRHIMGLSGGKDSTALAVLLHGEIPEMEYFFCDTGAAKSPNKPLAEVLSEVLDEEGETLPCLMCHL